MKKIKSFIFGFAVLSMALTSCQDDNTAPVISSFMVDGNAMKDSTLKITATLTDGEGLKSAKLTLETNGTTSELENLTLSGTSHSYSYSYKISSTATVGQTYKFTLEVMDDTKKEEDMLTASENKSVTVSSAAGDVTEYTVVLLGNQNDAAGSYYASSTNTVYSYANASLTANQSKIDFLHYNGSSNAATICSPNDETVGGGGSNFDFCQSWTTRNDTKFATTTIDYASVTDDSQLTAVSSSSFSMTKVTSLAVAGKFLFKTAAGKIGIAEVTQLSGTNTTAGTITLKVKVQE